jgi:hypothetical protein
MFFADQKNGIGSASSPISVGAVWLNPSETWQEIDYAEAILHDQYIRAYT